MVLGFHAPKQRDGKEHRASHTEVFTRQASKGNTAPQPVGPLSRAQARVITEDAGDCSPAGTKGEQFREQLVTKGFVVSEHNVNAINLDGVNKNSIQR